MVDISREQIKKHKGFLAVFSFLKYTIFLLIYSIAKVLKKPLMIALKLFVSICSL